MGVAVEEETATAPPRPAQKFIRRSLLTATYLLATAILLAPSVPTAAGKEAKLCGSLDIRNHPSNHFDATKDKDFIAKYKNCTILEGTFSMSMITNESIREDEFITFPEIVEITGYVLIFNVKALTSLNRIFPKLRVIGGKNLILDYALVIYQNPDLKDIGLTNLRVIRQGGVRITENPSLCYAEQIDWKRFLYGHIADVVVHDGKTSGTICMDKCDNDDKGFCHKIMKDGHYNRACWNGTTCQQSCPYEERFAHEMIDGKNESRRLLGPGCMDGTKVPCADNCIGGCYTNKSDCAACRNFLINGACQDACPKDTVKHNVRCISKDECFNATMVNVDGTWRKFKIAGDQCVFDCPAGFLSDIAVDGREVCIECKGACPKICRGKIIDSEANAEELRGCNIIEGFLDIQLKLGSRISHVSKIISAFNSIHTITHYLIIRFSPGLYSLAMFKNLTLIKGEQLYQNKYSLVIYENQNLNAIFPLEIAKNLKITNGKFQVHNNRMLCFKRITEFMNATGLGKVDEAEQSIASNGDKAICDERKLEISFQESMPCALDRCSPEIPHTLTVKWSSFNTSEIDHRKFLGYTVFFKKVDTDNATLVSIEDDRSACADSWSMHFEPMTESMTSSTEPTTQPPKNSDDKKNDTGCSEKTCTAMLEVQPASRYAVYVQTKMINHPGAQNAMSKVIIGRTQQGTPSAPKYKDARPIGRPEDGKILVEWHPPEHPNGVITHYVVHYTPEYTDLSYVTRHACNSHEMETVYKENVESHPLVSTTPASSLVSMITTSAPTTCAAVSGCCSCSAEAHEQERMETMDSDEYDKDGHDFENAVQNVVFVQGCEHQFDPRRCPSVSDVKEVEEGVEGGSNSTSAMVSTTQSPGRTTTRKGEKKEKGGKRHRRSHGHHRSMTTVYRIPMEGGWVQSEIEELRAGSRKKRSISEAPVEKDGTPDDDEDTADPLAEPPWNGTYLPIEDVEDVQFAHKKGYLLETHERPAKTMTQNVTDLKIILKGLENGVSYKIMVIACQNVSLNDSTCSNKPTYIIARALPLAHRDEVNVSTIASAQLHNDTNLGTRAMVKFEAPDQPNSRVVGFIAMLISYDNPDATALKECLNATQFAGGIPFAGVADGDYHVEVITITEHGYSEPVRADNLLSIRSPGWFTWPRIVSLLLVLFFLMFLLGLVLWQAYARVFAKKVAQGIHQTITCNPEYFSQFDTYKQDQWELKRENLELFEEIGRGTFGRVLRGKGVDVKSHCGVVFGDCAVKTVADETTPTDRIQFLQEANVMKQFIAPHIIKLYGVVSDGQPVYVVMEMMENGNLRDYLRSRRPDSEENPDNLPPPDDQQIFDWAAQIADGMAYLEYYRFCHRDLAARNCMMDHNFKVKIGDFGMARDVYYHEYYKPTGRRLMPVRWMSPEAIKDGKFTVKSDIWAFGIVIYEMMTFAQQPYPGMSNEDVCEAVCQKRKILDIPAEVDDFWREMMIACWKYEMRARPSFRQIVEILCPEYTTPGVFESEAWVMNEGADYEEVEFDENDQNKTKGVTETKWDNGDSANGGPDEVVVVNGEGGICLENRAGSDRNTANGGWKASQEKGAFANPQEEEAEAEL